MDEPTPAPKLAGMRLLRTLQTLADQAARDVERIGGSPATAIHNLRRRIKKLLALLRLIKEHLPPQTVAQIVDHARSLKVGVAGARDAEVMGQQAHQLDPSGTLANLLILPATTSPAGVGLQQSSAAASLRNLLAGLDLAGVTLKGLRHAHARQFRKARRCWKKARHAGDAEVLHRWRKQVKVLHYQSLWLRWSGQGRDRAIRQTRQLGHWLGVEHDLTLLLDRVTSLSAGGDPWLAKLRKKQARCHKSIFKLGDTLFAKKHE